MRDNPGYASSMSVGGGLELDVHGASTGAVDKRTR
jgi:hypothetical protein